MRPEPGTWLRRPHNTPTNSLLTTGKLYRVIRYTSPGHLVVIDDYGNEFTTNSYDNPFFWERVSDEP